eukprot:scaffold59109_cov67-Phaeocystis_antarctica.AAC.5
MRGRGRACAGPNGVRVWQGGAARAGTSLCSSDSGSGGGGGGDGGGSERPVPALARTRHNSTQRLSRPRSLPGTPYVNAADELAPFGFVTSMPRDIPKTLTTRWLRTPKD